MGVAGVAARRNGLAPNPSLVAITLIGRKARSQRGLRPHEVTSLDIREVTIHKASP